MSELCQRMTIGRNLLHVKLFRSTLGKKEAVMVLIKEVETYSPRPEGTVDILCGGQTILAMGKNLCAGRFPEMTVLDGKGLLAVPGFIDSHVHFLGGGGEGGYTTRAPEIRLTDLTMAGVTTAVGCLGTDGFTRSLQSLVAKSCALDREGISTFLYTGSYQVPPRTLFKTIEEDLLMIEKIIGVGEIAISDHRSSQPTLEELKKIASSARVGGMLSGKAGIVNIHVGGGKEGLGPLFDLTAGSDIPADQFLPTHINRSHKLAAQGKEWALQGGFVDLTASASPTSEESLRPARLFKEHFSEKNLSSRVTYSSDGQGSIPRFDEAGHFTGLGVGNCLSLLEEFRYSVLSLGLPLEEALLPLTSNPARILHLRDKGEIRPGAHADLLLFSRSDLELRTVIARGVMAVSDGTPLIRGMFEV